MSNTKEYGEPEDIADDNNVRHQYPNSNGNNNIEDYSTNQLGNLRNFVSFFTTINGFFFMILFFIFILIVSEAVSSIEDYFKTGNIGGLIYIFGLLFVLFVLSGNVYVIWRQIRRIKEVEHIRSELKKQEENPTENIFVLRDKIFFYYEHSNYEDIKEQVKELRQHHKQSGIYEDVYKDLDEKFIPLIDKKAEKKVREASVQTALSVAISPVPVLDMVFVAWRSIRLTKEIAKLYGYRPGIYTSIVLLKKGITNVAFAGISDMATEIGSDSFLSSIFGKVFSAAAQGIANGILLARFGYGVIEACRPIKMKKQQRNNFLLLSIKEIKEHLADDSKTKLTQ